MISFDILIKDLINLGVKKGDVLVVHSSLKSMGKVDGGANTVIDGLIEVVGKEGTILFPALTYSPCYSTLKFDVKNTPSCVGYISEVFRNRPDIIRSFHPTHSVCAFGKFAKEITKDHFIDDTPVGENSPYQKLIHYGGKILMLGCGLNPNTFMHGVEEIANAPYCLGEYWEYEMTDYDGNVIKKKIKRHNFHRSEGSLVQRYDRAVDVLERGKDYFEGVVHGAKAYLFDAKILLENALKKMNEDPYYFIDDENNILKIK